MTIRRKNLTYLALVTALIVSAILVRYLDPFFVRSLRLIAFDSYQRLHPQPFDQKLGTQTRAKKALVQARSEMEDGV